MNTIKYNPNSYYRTGNTSVLLDYVFIHDIGNRATASEAGTSTNYTANDLNQYTAVGNTTPTYDDDGNLLTYDGWTYTWDIAGQLTTAAKGTQRLEFEYDHIGRRRGKKYYQNNTLTYFYRFVYDGFKLIAVLDGNNNNAEIMSFVWSPAGDDTPLCMTYGGATYLYAADGNKNITGLFDTAGTRAANYVYGPFGQIVSQTGTMAGVNPFRFSSEFYDAETDLVYYNYRYYSPALGRWLSRDPIQEQGGMNLYGMVANNPIDSHDKLGLLSFFQMLRWDITGVPSRKELTRLLCILRKLGVHKDSKLSDTYFMLQNIVANGSIMYGKALFGQGEAVKIEERPSIFIDSDVAKTENELLGILMHEARHHVSLCIDIHKCGDTYAIQDETLDLIYRAQNDITYYACCKDKKVSHQSVARYQFIIAECTGGSFIPCEGGRILGETKTVFTSEEEKEFKCKCEGRNEI